jgi:hypothetical protein
MIRVMENATGRLGLIKAAEGYATRSRRAAISGRSWWSATG